MLTIRKSQLVAFGASMHDRFVTAMCKHLLAHFPHLAKTSAPELRARVAEGLADAARYGLSSEQDGCRYLNLAGAYGWQFDRAPELAWMRARLTDPEVSSPTNRLKLLVDECIHREAVAEENRRIRSTPPPAPEQAPEPPAPTLTLSSAKAANQNIEAETEDAMWSELELAVDALERVDEPVLAKQGGGR